MANKKSALKAARQAERRVVRNKPIRSSIRTYVKKALVALDAVSETSSESVLAAVSAVDKAAQKGIIHPNTAARRKSRLMLRLNAVTSGAVSAPVAPVKKVAAPKATAGKAKAAPRKAAATAAPKRAAAAKK